MRKAEGLSAKYLWKRTFCREVGGKMNQFIEIIIEASKKHNCVILHVYLNVGRRNKQVCNFVYQ